MVEWYGWAGTILNVDLTLGRVTKERLSKESAVKYIGGSGLGVRTLYDEVGPEVDPLSPENIFIVGQGPLCGTGAPSCGRYEIVTKSPQTGIYLRSNGGGFFGPELKWAGYDLVIVRGRSEKPVYLWIYNDDVEIRNAGHLWGKDTWTTQQIICSELGDPEIRTLKIGPSGENLGISSCVIGDLDRAAGKGASGAVMGSKKLKAIAVRGSKGVNIARPEEFLEACMALQKRFRQDPMHELHSRSGPPAWVAEPYVKTKGMSGLLSTEFNKLFDKNLACSSCPIHCSHWYSVKDGKYKGTVGAGVEGLTIITGGISTGIDSAAFVCKFNTVCNQLGLNVETPGLAIAWATRLYEDGIITREDTDGIELTRGNEEAVLKMLHKIAYRDGFGNTLDGFPLRAAEKIGRGSLATAHHIKGLSAGAGVGGQSIEYAMGLAVSTRGCDNSMGAPTWSYKMSKVACLTPEVVGKIGEKYGDRRVSTEPWYVSPKKALWLYDMENICALCDMTGVCKFASERAVFSSGWHKEDFATMLSLVTGVDYTPEALVRASERQILLERAFNARAGIRRIDDYPVPFYWELKYKERHPSFNYAAFPIDLKTYDKMLDEYYRLRGCDLATGIPTRGKLEEVGLKDVADDLEKREILQHKTRKTLRRARG